LVVKVTPFKNKSDHMKFVSNFEKASPFLHHNFKIKSKTRLFVHYFGFSPVKIVIYLDFCSKFFVVETPILKRVIIRSS
jgi:hypothetical protein